MLTPFELMLLPKQLWRLQRGARRKILSRYQGNWKMLPESMGYKHDDWLVLEVKVRKCSKGKEANNKCTTRILDKFKNILRVMWSSGYMLFYTLG